MAKPEGALGKNGRNGKTHQLAKMVKLEIAKPEGSLGKNGKTNKRTKMENKMVQNGTTSRGPLRTVKWENR